MKGFFAAFGAAILVTLAIVAVRRGGFVVPGMHVDVIISGTPPSGSGGLRTQTTTLLQNIEVLSAIHDFKKDA